MLKKSQHDRDWCVNIRNIKHQLYFDTFCLLLCFYFKEKITVCILNCQIITYLLGSLGELLLSSFFILVQTVAGSCSFFSLPTLVFWTDALP